MGIEDITNKAKALFTSEKAEQISDSVLDTVESTVNKVTGDKFADQVGQARDKADGAVGNE